MVSAPAPTGAKKFTKHLIAYSTSVLSIGAGCAIVFSRQFGPPWDWPRGIPLAWAVFSGLFGLILGLAIDNLPPAA
jgi:hypothetical protein